MFDWLIPHVFFNPFRYIIHEKVICKLEPPPPLLKIKLKYFKAYNDILFFNKKSNNETSLILSSSGARINCAVTRGSLTLPIHMTEYLLHFTSRIDIELIYNQFEIKQ